MCLIITGKAKKVITTLLETPRLLDDILESNGDGIGAMYVTSKQKLRMPKAVVTKPEQVMQFLRSLPPDDRDLALHFRFRTHGDVDTINCHPYEVLPGEVGMMHNGVLTVDDSSDETKSDTWHYIKQYVAPQLQVAPELFLVPAWQEIVEEHIGNSNRFVLMNNRGDMAILNEHTGVHHDGMWFSNTYAWTPSILISGFYRTSKNKKFDRWDDEDDFGGWTLGGTTAAQAATKVYGDQIRELVLTAIADGDADKMNEYLRDYPITTFDQMLKNYTFRSHVPASQLPQTEGHIIDLLEHGLPLAVQSMMKDSPTARRLVAECMCYYGTWKNKTTGEELLPERVRDEDFDKDAQQHVRSVASEKLPVLVKPATDVDPLGKTTPFEVGKIYKTRDGLGFRKVEAIDPVESTITVSDTETALRSDRWMDGRCLVGSSTGRDLMLPAWAAPANDTKQEPIEGPGIQAETETLSDLYAG